MKKLIVIIVALCAFAIGDSLFAKDFYWVRGSGDWSGFFSKWAYSSNGNPLDTGLVPGPYDDVYFDNYSFGSDDTLKIVINSNAVCRTLDFSQCENLNKYIIIQKPTNISLRVFGSLLLIEDMGFNAEGSVEFNGENRKNIIRTAGHPLNSIVFDGKGGSWEFEDDITLSGELTMNHGSIDTKGKNISCYSLTVNTPDTLLLNSSQITIAQNAAFNDSTTYIPANTSHLFFDNIFATLVNYSKLNDVSFLNNSGDVKLYGMGKYNHLTFKGKAYIVQNNTMDILEFSPAKDYRLEKGSQQTILSDFIVTGNCPEYIAISSTADATPATIKMESGSITISNVILKDINTAGGAGFNAINTVGVGNTAGWNIQSPAPRTLYWVGNSGKWNEPEHWALSPGGTGGECPPLPIDNVFFDQNSFTSKGETVTIDGFVDFCRDLNLEAVDFEPTLFLVSMPFRVYGSLTLSPAMTFKYPAPASMQFLGNDQAHFIKTNGNAMPHTEFSRHGGKWDFRDDFGGTGRILLEFGSLDTKNNKVNCLYFLIFTSETINLNNSDIYVRYTVGFTNATTNVIEGQSNIYIEAPNSDMTNVQQLYNVTFTDPAGIPRVNSNATYNNFTYRGDAQMVGRNTINNFTLSAGHNYIFEANKGQSVLNSFRAIGNCEEYIYIGSDKDSVPTKIFADNAVIEASYLVMKDVFGEGKSTFRANNSVDMGNNAGWTFSHNSPRNLYWVAGTGEWNQKSHWSLISGGVGGECPPTPYDNVMFDEYSFPQDTQKVNIVNSVAFCRDFIWNDVTGMPKFSNSDRYDLRVYGSFSLSKSMKFDFLSGTISFLADTRGHKLNTAGHLMPNTVFNRVEGGWELTDNYKSLSNLSVINGTFNTNGNNIELGNLGIYTPDAVSFGKSIFKIAGNVSIDNPKTTLDAGTSHFYFKDINHTLANAHTLYDVSATNKSSIQIVISGGKYHNLSLAGDAILPKSITVDSLYLSPGHDYTLFIGTTLSIIRDMSARGNQCYPIYIHTDSVDRKAEIYKQSGQLSCDFLELHDINTSGGAEFYAGDFSINYNNSSNGWRFENSFGYIYGLGHDATVCRGEKLETFNFNGAESFLWSDGSTNNYFAIESGGEIWVQVTYGNDCIYRDTINVSVLDNALLTGSEDFYTCSANTSTKFSINIQEGIAPYQINWTPEAGIDYPNSSEVNIFSPVSTQYIVTVRSTNGCEAKDTVNYWVIPDIKPSITREGDYLVSNIAQGNQWFLDGVAIPGANSDRIIPFEKGQYSVQINNEECASLISDAYHFYDNATVDVVIQVGSAKAKAGEDIAIPISILNYQKLLDNNITKFDAELTYNPNILYEQNTPNSPGSISKTIPITLNYDANNPTIWAKLNFTSMLGKSNKSSLMLSDHNIAADNIKIGIINGVFFVNEICNQGGNRYFSDASRTALHAETPDIAPQKLNIDYYLANNAEIELAIYDVYGNRIRILESGKYSKGSYSKEYTINEFASGMYLCVLKSDNRLYTQRIMIIK